MIINRRLSKQHQKLVWNKNFLNSQNYVFGNYAREVVYDRFYSILDFSKMQKIFFSLFVFIYILALFSLQIVFIFLPVLLWLIIIIFRMVFMLFLKYKNRLEKCKQKKEVVAIFWIKRKNMHLFFQKNYIFKKRVKQEHIVKKDFLIFKK